MPAVTSLNAVHETGSGTAATVSNYLTKNIFVAVAGLSTGGRVTVKIKQSSGDSQPSWDAAASPTNRLSLINCKKLSDIGNVDGNTGLVFTAGTAQAFEVYVNNDGSNFINTDVTQNSSSTTASVTSVINAWT